MSGPLAGIRVVDLGFFVAGPAAAGIMADWGADVIKIEPFNGDPMRGFYSAGFGMEMPLNPAFELDNRGKRSICLNLEAEGGRALAEEIIAGADVVVTNLRLKALQKLGFDYESLHRKFPRLVYCLVTGFGSKGPDCNRPAFDVGAFWSRAGVAATLTPPDRDPPVQRTAMGDHMTGITAAGAICAALVARGGTGKGQLVETSLLRVGGYFIGSDLNVQLRLQAPAVAMTRQSVPNPLINCYRDRNGKMFWLLGLQGDRHWPDLLRAIDRMDLKDDPRFNTMPKRRENCALLMELLDAIFVTRTLTEWQPVFDQHDVWWAPVQNTQEVIADPQARACGMFVAVPTAEGNAEMIATPADFAGQAISVRSASPECGQHTEELLLEMGRDWEQIGALKEGGIIP